MAWDIHLRCRGDVHVERWSGKYGVQEKNKIGYRVMTLGNFIEGVRVNEERQNPRTEPLAGHLRGWKDEWEKNRGRRTGEGGGVLPHKQDGESVPRSQRRPCVRNSADR